MLVAVCPSNILVYLMDKSAWMIVCATTLRQKLQMKHAASSIQSKLTPGHQVLALALIRHGGDRKTTKEQASKRPLTTLIVL